MYNQAETEVSRNTYSYTRFNSLDDLLLSKDSVINTVNNSLKRTNSNLSYNGYEISVEKSGECVLKLILKKDK